MRYRQVLLRLACLAISPGVFAQTTALNYRIIDAEFSQSLNRLITVSALPNRVNIYNPDTRSTVASLPLPVAPTAVSVSPDGRSAVVGHDGFMSIVDLEQQAVTRTLQARVDVLDIVHGGNGFAYLFPRRDQWSSIHSVRLSDGADLTPTTGQSIYAGTLGRLHPSGKAIYGANNGLSPSDIEKYDISAGPLTMLYDSPYHGDYAMCGNVWPTADGQRLVTACGNIFRASEIRSEDMTYNGRLSGVTRVVSAAHAPQTGRLIVLDDTSTFLMGTSELAIFDYEFLAPLVRMKLPPLSTNGRLASTTGKFVFASQDGSKAIVVLQGDPEAGLLFDYGIAVIDLKHQVLNSASLNMTPVAPGQIVSLFGSQFAGQTAVPTIYPPPDSLLGRTAKFQDSTGIERIARIYYIGPDQVNLLIPQETALGPGRLILDAEMGRLADVQVQVESIQPGIYTANGNGTGPAAALVTRVESTGQTTALTFQANPTGAGFINRPIDLGTDGTQVYVSLFGTGFSRATRATARIQNVAVPVSGFAPQPETAGLDQINIGPIPQSLRGVSDVPVTITFDGAETNAVTLSFR